MWRYPSRGLKDELQLLVAAHVAAPRDRAALCIAAPPLGHKAIKAIPASYKGPPMSLSNRVSSADNTPRTTREGGRSSGPAEGKGAPRLKANFERPFGSTRLYTVSFRQR